MLNTLMTKAYVSLNNAMHAFKKDQKGVTAIEYGLIAVAMAVFIVAIFYSENSFITALKAKFDSLINSVKTPAQFAPTSGNGG
ncbi:MAG: Flp family type IVb pilin [Pasteurellaceae bacterium]|nr:Flp family type IVb pilin [Pasteurellaceae bacterium]